MRTPNKLLTYVQHQQTYLQKVRSIAPANLVALWSFDDASGTSAVDASGNGFNGTYVNTPTLGATGCGDGGTAVTFAAASSQYCNLFATGIGAALNSSEGSLNFFIKPTGGMWTDGSTPVFVAIRRTASSNEVYVQKTAANAVGGFYIAGGTSKQSSASGLGSPTDFIPIGFTWSKIADQAILYIRGIGKTPATSLGVMTGAFTSAFAAAYSAAALFINGTMDNISVFNVALDATSMLALATKP